MLSIRGHVLRMAALAWPIIVAELGWMAMGLVDTVMVAPLGKEAIGAVGVANILYDTFGIFALGLLLGLDPLVAQAFGAGRPEDANRFLRQGVWLALFLTPPTMLMALSLPGLMTWTGVQPPVRALAGPYIDALAAGTLPLLLYAAFRRFLQATGRVRPVMVALLLANGVNAAANAVLIHGAWGVPAFGVAGSGWATAVARLFLAVWLLAATRWDDVTGLWSRGLRWVRPCLADLRELLRLGAPAAGQIGLEIAVFGAATMLAGRLSTTSLAAHHIALNLASLTFMVPLGISSAGAVAVGHALGRGEPAEAKRAGWVALGFAGAFMSLAGVVFALAPRWLLGVFTNDPELLAIGAGLLRFAAVFQLFDGLQVAATGVLRGAAETRLPMAANLAGHWAIGLPLGYYLCFGRGMDAAGLWAGLSAGLIIVALVLVGLWWRRPLRPVAS
ncbi:MAG: MATE family efflux transporter [Acidobacteriota bacterium]|jgi:MATE family multidrug resistance protein|nr:MATE family efflux transporter [Bryobacteraceae bacterium CoA2 C42]MCA2962653.1 MATE family efflux transporter [Acidobacteriaceae bacterium]